MIYSLQDLYSDAQAITASAASTNYYDRGVAGTPYGAAAAVTRDWGKGNLIPIRIQVVTAFATCDSVKVAVQTDSDPGFATALTTVLETEAIATASLVAGYQFNIDYMPLKTLQRYVRLYYTVAGSNATAGKITAGHVLANQTA
jgi:hypothetical protein